MPRVGLLPRLAGVERLEAQLHAQDRATAQHRTWEGEILSGIRAEAAEIKGLAESTNGRVDRHDLELAVIKKAEEEAIKLQAAKVLAAETAKSRRVNLKQGLMFVITGALTTAGLHLLGLLP